MNEQESTDHTDQADDVEAHRFRPGKADAEAAEGADDVEAHVYVQEPKDLKS